MLPWGHSWGERVTCTLGHTGWAASPEGLCTARAAQGDRGDPQTSSPPLHYSIAAFPSSPAQKSACKQLVNSGALGGAEHGAGERGADAAGPQWGRDPTGVVGAEKSFRGEKGRSGCSCEHRGTPGSLRTPAVRRRVPTSRSCPVTPLDGEHTHKRRPVWGPTPAPSPAARGHEQGGGRTTLWTGWGHNSCPKSSPVQPQHHASTPKSTPWEAGAGKTQPGRRSP